jgi:formate dehydrogenase alpha subunit
MAKQITLNIDGQEVVVPEGTTILQAAESVQIEIPRLCYFPGLPPSGSCRLCLVELEGQKRLAVSCTQRVRENMVVHTHSDRVLDARRFVLELIWSTHPGDCTTCEKSGACDLQRYTYELNVDKKKYPLHAPEGIPEDLGDPLIERNLSLCILCGRCIRACREQSQGILDFMQRGMSTFVTTSLNNPLLESGCDFCGSCVAVCPVGCLVERNRKLRGREWEFESTETRCTFCSLGCDMIVDMAHGDIVRTRPGKGGYLCVRGKFGWDYLASEDRISKPLIRHGERLAECDWDEALDHIAHRLTEIRETRGPDAIGGIIGAHATNEAVHVFGELFRNAIGTKNVESTGDRVAFRVLETFGNLAPLASVADLERAKRILAVGPSLGESYPRARLAIKRAVDSGAKLVVVDTNDSELSRLATLHLKAKPGMESAVLEGIARGLVDAELHDAESLASMEGASKAIAKIGPYDAGRTGVSDEQVAEAAKLFAKGRGVVAVSDLRGGTVSRTLALLILTGRSRRALLPLHPAANPWANVLLGRDDTDVLGKDLAALFIVGANFTARKSKLPDVEFLVVQDLFFTETVKRADVILPLNGFAEEEGTVLGPGAKLIPMGAGAPAVGPPTWQIFSRLSEKLGHEMGYRSSRDVRRAVKEAADKLSTEVAIRFPTSNESGKPENLRSFERFDLPEAAWTTRSQIAGIASSEKKAMKTSTEPIPPADEEVAR